ncbi:MAG: hypothetical protein HY057_07550, partial [Rhodospirillales bacterium]|nr:hypothetical protein [Rhodospirillales bacterium]
MIFYERRSGTASAYRLELRASLDGATYPILLARFDTTTSTTSYVQRVVNLQLAGLANAASVRLQWLLLKDSTNSTGTLRIDDVSLTVLTSFDVGVNRLSVLPTAPTSKDALTLNAVVKNFGTLSASNVSVNFYRDANNDRVPQPSELIGSSVVGSLASNDSTTATIAIVLLTPGEHRFIAAAALALDEVPANDTLSAVISV